MIARRSGAVYLLVLLSTLVIAATGLAALQLSRVQNATSSGNNNFIEARTIARSAIDIGMLKIRNTPTWRTSLGNGTWVTNQALGDGTYSLSAVDPIDNSVAQGDNHPIILTGTGSVGGATFKTAVRLEVGPAAGSCLEVSMISGNDSTVTSATLTSDQTVSANGTYTASSATVNANVEAVKGISGSTYTKTNTNKTVAREMPDSSTVLSYYTTNGTTISYSDLPQFTQTEECANGAFETDTSGWSIVGGTATMARSTTQKKAGAYSLLVSSRSASTAVASYNLALTSLSSGSTYQLWIPIYPSSNFTTAQAVLTLTSSGSGVQTFSTPVISVGRSSWNDLKANVSPTWTGTLTQATLSISINNTTTYYIDAVSMLDVTYPTNVYLIDRQLLSPAHNPFGSQQLNSQGIYIIDCNDKDVVVGRSRIVGTLLFIKPGGNSIIQGSVIWEAAVPNFPALLVQETTLEIGFNSSAGLDEGSLSVNFNPSGTPYPYNGGAANSTLTDSYPSKITGLLYSQQDWNFSGAPSISGVIIADNNINVSASSLTLSYGSAYLSDPPPGFTSSSVTMKAVPGTWQRSIN